MSWKLRAVPFLVLLLPFDLAVACSLCAAFLLMRRKRNNAAPQLCDSTKATIIIVNWDGKRLLAECLPSVLEAVTFDGRDHQVMIVDNGSSDGSVEFVRSNFPSVRVLALDRNYGFSGGNRRGIELAETDVVVLLNNDMIVERGFLRPLLDGFSDPGVFAVSSQIFFSDPHRRREETGKTRARFDSGFFYLWHDDIDSRDELRETLPVFWAGGGSCAIDRKKYLAIGGFDLLYEPFYLEDTDLSYQAWKRGWQSLLAPASRVIHKHRATSRTKFGEEFVENTIRRNQFLFVWKNVTDVSMTFAHLANLPRIHARAIRDHGPAFELRAFSRAFRRLPLALGSRIANRPAYASGDREVIRRSRKQS